MEGLKKMTLHILMWFVLQFLLLPFAKPAYEVIRDYKGRECTRECSTQNNGYDGTFRSKFRCKSDSPCSKHGHYFKRCYTEGGGWYYCGDVRSDDHLVLTQRSTEQPKCIGQVQGQPWKLCPECTKKLPNGQYRLLYGRKPKKEMVETNKKDRQIINNFIATFKEDVIRSKSSGKEKGIIYPGRDVGWRLDKQGDFPVDAQRYLNLQIQKNVLRNDGKGTTVSQVAVWTEASYSSEDLHAAFRMSLEKKENTSLGCKCIPSGPETPLHTSRNRVAIQEREAKGSRDELMREMEAGLQ
ncbi:unnamed protein product [Darwinula stevensoni]|uniref:Uncharacterized protein n=1 Tax=Darwinula stevensoni TaxID=69355 RepID=A0A7R9AH37_9CRUS|nr:unnamed protein product [Darwinula stevensoni]CAG0905035.1 unnamed protein product [Darwinula stevensoni]